MGRLAAYDLLFVLLDLSLVASARGALDLAEGIMFGVRTEREREREEIPMATENHIPRWSSRDRETNCPGWVYSHKKAHFAGPMGEKFPCETYVCISLPPRTPLLHSSPIPSHPFQVLFPSKVMCTRGRRLYSIPRQPPAQQTHHP